MEEARSAGANSNREGLRRGKESRLPRSRRLRLGNAPRARSVRKEEVAISNSSNFIGDAPGTHAPQPRSIAFLKNTSPARDCLGQPRWQRNGHFCPNFVKLGLVVAFL